MARRDTGHVHINLIATGYFHEKEPYAVWRSHGTDDWLLNYTAGGHGRYGHVNGEIISDIGDIVLIKPRTLHDYGVEKTLRRWDVIWAHFHPRPAWHEWLNWPEESPGLMRLRLRDPHIRRSVAKRFEQVHELAQGALRRRETFAMNALEEVLLWCDQENPLSQKGLLDARVRDAMEYLCRNLARKVTLDDLADAGAISVSRLCHLFRQQSGVTPQQFLERQRMNRAVQLLEMTPLSVKEIASQVGFDNPFYFTLRFKKHFSRSPREYRRHREMGRKP